MPNRTAARAKANEAYRAAHAEAEAARATRDEAEAAAVTARDVYKAALDAAEAAAVTAQAANGRAHVAYATARDAAINCIA